MRLLVIHQNFPGQFAHLIKAWSQRAGWEVIGLGRETAPGVPGFDKFVRYRLARGGSAKQHPYLRQMEAATLHGQAVARALLEMKRRGFVPDAILAHPGWGETLYAKDVFPDARLVHLCEWYYDTNGADLGFDPEFPLTFDDRARIRTWNALHTLNLTHCDVAISPTLWQRSRHPEIFRSKIGVKHEGIDLERLGPRADAVFRTPSGQVFRPGDPVVTYVARNLEPYRGFHVFMRALERVQAKHPRCHALIVGADGVSYGRKPPNAATWREEILSTVRLDPQRTHFLGRLPHAAYLDVLRVSAAHVYLTYPFVLSWSLLEAMACGTAIVASDTAPVREVIDGRTNGLLRNFFDADAIAEGVLDLLEPAPIAKDLRMGAAVTASRFDHRSALEVYEGILRGGAPLAGNSVESVVAAAPLAAATL